MSKHTVLSRTALIRIGFSNSKIDDVSSLYLPQSSEYFENLRPRWLGWCGGRQTHADGTLPMLSLRLPRVVLEIGQARDYAHDIGDNLPRRFPFLLSASRANACIRDGSRSLPMTSGESDAGSSMLI